MATDRVQILVQTLSRLPLFQGVPEAGLRAFLAASRPRRFDAGETVCAADTPSDDLWVLLSGALGVVDEDGSLVTTLTPVTTVGEMGLVIRQPRRAAVEAVDACNLLVLPRAAFEEVLSTDADLRARVYRNMVDILSDKLVQDNVRMREYLVEKVRHEDRLREARQRAGAAFDLLVEGGMPRQRAESQIAERVDREPRLRILIVDDEPEMRHLLSVALADYDVVEARDGEEALEEIGDEPPDLVITDLRMPGIDGYTLVRRLKARFPETPVLAISGYATDDDVIDHEFDAFLEKPMNLRELRELVDIALSGGDDG